MFGDLVLEEIIVNQFLQSFSSPALDLFFNLVTFLGHPAFWILIGAWFFWSGKEKKSFALISLILFSTVVAGALKILIARPRPEGVISFEEKNTFSMPSGHATTISSVFFFAQEKIKPLEKQLFILGIILVLISRMYLGYHYLSDVLAGVLLGLVVGKLFWFSYEKLKRISSNLTQNEGKIFIILLVITLFCLELLPDWLFAGFLIIGYYLGYIIYKMKNMTLKPKNKLLSVGIGTIIFGALGVTAYINHGIISQVLFLIAGIFITLIWPMIINKLKI